MRDAVLNQGNAGDYDYTEEVVYPFGYGLSYTTFDWSNMQTTWSGDECTVTVDVENTGDMAGKDVVEIYAQSPYTEYDKANRSRESFRTACSPTARQANLHRARKRR